MLKKIAFLMITGIVFFSHVRLVHAGPWQPLPLRTEAQKLAGMPGGEGMQRVFSISYALSNPNIAYFVSNTSSVWKSTDGGYSWQSKRNAFRSNGGVSLVVDPGNEEVVFVSGSKQDSNNTSPVDGIYRTLDGGESWELVKQTAYYPNEEGQHFVFDPRSFNGERHMTIYAGTHTEGLLKSTDGGDNWTVSGMDGIWILDIEINVDDSNNAVVLYVAAKDGLYKAIDDGINPVTISPLGDLPVYPGTIALNPQSGPANDIIYAAAGTYKIYKSTNGGQNFIEKSNGLPDPPNWGEYKMIDISRADPDYLYTFVDQWWKNPFYSHDGGENWYESTDIDVNGLSFGDGSWFSSVTATHPSDRDVALRFFGGNGRIAKTTDGGDTWQYSGNGYMGARRDRNKTSTYFDPVDPDRKIFFLTDYGPAITEDNGDTWRLLMQNENDPKTTPAGAVDPDNPDIIITAKGGWDSQRIARSTDGGQTWKFFNGTDGVTDDTEGNYLFISLHPQNPNYVYAGTYYDYSPTVNGSWISRDKGASWSFIPDKVIRAVFPDNGDIVYAFQECIDVNNPVDGCTQDKSILWLSQDKGGSWTWVALNPLRLSSIYDVDIDPNNSNRLYAAAWADFYVYDGTINATPDETIRWTGTGKSGGIPVETFGSNEYFVAYSVVVDPINPNIVYTGMRLGDGHRERFIYRSVDDGQTWKDIGYNLDGYSSVWSLAVDPANGDLYMNLSHGNYVLSPDTERDGIMDDGDNSGIIGDNKCTGGNTGSCDDNCPYAWNPDQADIDGDGFGTVCDCNDNAPTVPANLPVRIDGAIPEYYSTLQAAYDAAIPCDIIQSQAIIFTEDLNINRGILVTLEGGYDCDYTANTGETILNGAMTINNGTVIVEDFVLE